jgi:hypothetical protein
LDLIQEVRKFVDVKKSANSFFLYLTKTGFFSTEHIFSIFNFGQQNPGSGSGFRENRSVSDPYGTVLYVAYSLSLDQDPGFGGSRSRPLGKSRSGSVPRFKLT